MKKTDSDMVFKPITPPDYKKNMTAKELSEVLVTRLGLKRKASRADHAKLLVELLAYKKENVPVQIEQMAQILGVSPSQAYEELRKWRTLGLIEFVKVPNATGTDTNKGYILAAATVNRLMDKVESSLNAFVRETKRISKDFDDLFMLELVRKEKGQAAPEPQKDAENEAKLEEKPSENEDNTA